MEVAAPATKVVDTIGAGDTFQGSLLVALRDAGRIARPALEAIGRAASTCSRAGANPPWKADV